jgi:putative protease
MTERLVFDTPRELNKKELEQLRYPINGVAETCVYGREVLMVTAQCMTKTLRNTCLRESAEERGRWHWISDDRGNRFLTYSDCRCCYNLVYNGVPLSLHGALGEMGRIRLDFTSEVPEEVKRLLTDFSAAYEEGREFVPDYAYTTGHFNRGIE